MADFEPSPFPGTMDQIEDIACRIRANAVATLNEGRPPFGMEEVRLFLERLVHSKKGQVRQSPLPSWQESEGGSLVVQPHGAAFEIRLSPNTPPLRDNFTIAHELGHYALHYPHAEPRSDAVRFHRYGSGPVEAQANRFAAAFLMPRDEFLAALERYDGDEYAVAGHFGVSQPAVAVRRGYVR